MSEQVENINTLNNQCVVPVAPKVEKDKEKTGPKKTKRKYNKTGKASVNKEEEMAPDTLEKELAKKIQIEEQNHENLEGVGTEQAADTGSEFIEIQMFK